MIALPARNTPTSTPARSIRPTKSAIDMPCCFAGSAVALASVRRVKMRS